MSRRQASQKKLWYRDPLHLTALVFTLVWGLMACLGRPIGDYGVETDFYGDFVPMAHRWIHEGPQVGNGFRGPFYYVLLGVLGQSFMAGKLLSVLASGIGLRFVGSIVATVLDRRAALLAMLALAANAVFVELSFRAASDPIFFALFTSTLVLCLPKPAPAAGRKGAETPETPHRPQRWLAAGLLAGSAWLTRYNGIALLPAGLLFAAVFARPGRFRAMGAFAAGWLILALPWALFLWKQTGDPFWNTNYQNLAIAVYAPSPSMAQQGAFMRSVGFASAGEVIAVNVSQTLLVLGRNLFSHFGQDVMTLVAWPWALVSLAGYALTWRRWRTPLHVAFLITGFMTYLTLLPAFYNARFMLPLLLWWVTGIGAFGIALPRFLKSADSRRRSVPLTLGLLSAFIVWAQIREIRQSLDRASSKGCPSEILFLAKDAKRRHLSINDTTPIAARKPQVGYYLGAPVVALPFGSLEDLQQTGARYLLVSGAEVATSSSLMPLLDPRPGAPKMRGLTLVASANYDVGGGRSRRAMLYAIDNPKPYVPPPTVPQRPERTTVDGLSRNDTLRLRLGRWLLIWAPDTPLEPLMSRITPEARTHPEILALEGDEKLMRGDRSGAKTLYTEMLSKTSGDGAHLRLAGIAYLEGDSASVTQELNQLNHSPSMHDWYVFANERQAKGVFAEAIAPFAACVDADSLAGPCCHGLARTLLQAGQRERAIAVLEECIKKRPGDAELKSLREQIQSGAKRVALGPR